MCEHGGIDELDSEGLLDVAEAALRRLGRLPLGAAVADTALTRCVQRLEAVARVAQGTKLTMVAEISQREAHRGHAAASTPDLLARVLHLAPGEARAQAELAAGLALVPNTAAALRDGRIGIGQAAVTVKKAEEVKDRDDAQELLAKIDQTASTAGQTLDRNRLAREIDTTVARAGVDVLAERERTAHARRRLDVTTRDGMTIIHAELDPYAGAQVRAALDALSKKDSDGDTRPFHQRQADALAQMASMARNAMPEGTAMASRVLLMVASRCAGRRRNRPAALQGTRPRLGLGHPEFALGGPGHRPRPPQASARARTAGTNMSGVRRGNRPRVLAMRQRHMQTAAGHTDVHPSRAGPLPRPESRDDTPRGGTATTTSTSKAGKSPATTRAATAPAHPTSSHRTLKTP